MFRVNKQQWKKEYQKWRSFFRTNILSTIEDWHKHNEAGLAHGMATSIKCDAVRKMAHPAIYYALFNRDYTCRVRLITEGKWAIRCNMDLSPQQIEEHRLKAYGKTIDYEHYEKTRLARFSRC